MVHGSSLTLLRRLGLVAWLLVLGVTATQTGLATLLEQEIAAAEPAGDGCDDAGDGCQERCPGETSDGTCPPQCDHCRCCTGTALAVIPWLDAAPAPVRAILARSAGPERVVLGLPYRVFRPPRAAPAC